MKSIKLSVISSPFDGTQLCSLYDTNIFYPDSYEETDVAKARSICNDCWLKDKCLDYAIMINEKEGVWGATTPIERKRLRRKLMRK